MSPDASCKAIGIFDSGVGGLTVFRAVAERMPREHIVYLGDTARVPYGTKSPEIVTQYARACARLLLERGVKLMVVACNTASAFGLGALQSELPVPVIGVIEPGAQRAASLSRGGRIGVVGTAGTISSGQYQEALLRYYPGAEVFCQECPLFVPLAEEGWTSGKVPMEVAATYLASMRCNQTDTLLLGCTHYPLLREVISSVMGPQVTIVDSASATAEAVESTLDAMGLRRPPESDALARHAFLVTDDPARFALTGQRFLGNGLALAEWVAL